jgi:hypothetical protein
MFSVKHIYKKTTNKKWMLKKNPTIHFACETNGIEPPVCVTTKPWTCRFWLSISDYDRRVKCADIMCWMYTTHTASKTYGDLKSFQTAILFQLRSSLSFAYFLDFFCASYKKSRNLYGTNYLSVSKWKIKF